jgi:hypothetical protein
MTEEPNPELHHIFSETNGGYLAAYDFYLGLKKDDSISEVRAEIQPPRQGVGGVWLIDKVNA